MSKPEPANRRIKDLVKFLREERVTWHSLVVGDVTIDGAQDMKLLADLPARRPGEPRKDIFERYGAALLEAPTPEAETFSPVVEDEE